VDFPDTEYGKIEFLRRLELLNPEREECFDRITRLACSLLRVPVALISFPDQDLYWFKSTAGLTCDQIPKNISFCIHADAGPLVVQDAWQDPRFRDNPLVVSDPHVRFYASAPITLEPKPALCASGPPIHVGTLSVVDHVPNLSFSIAELEILKDLAGMVTDLIKVRLADVQLVEAEAALRQTERHYRTLFENCPIGIYRTSVDGEVLLANPFILKMLGYDSLDELRSQNIEHDHKVADRAQFKRILSRDGEVTNRRATWYAKDGHPVLVSECAKAVRGESGEIIFYEGTVEDVTERSAAEARFRVQEQRWELVVRANNDGIWDWNPSGHNTFYSDRYFEMLGYRPGEIAKDVEIWEKLVFAEDFERVSAQLNAHLRGESECYEAEYRMHAKDGSLRWVLSRGKAHIAADGSVTRVVGSHTDITERKNNEERLKKVQEQYRQLFESNPLPTLVYEMKTRSILAVNAMAEHLYGYSRGEFLSMTVGDLVLPEQRAQLEAQVDRLGQSVVRSERWVNITKDGRRLTVEMSSHAVDFDGRPARLATINDVTEMIQVQDQLQLALAEATEAARVKSNFLATMSHEIRTPMNGIVGMTGLLREAGLTDDQRECVDTIQSSSEALMEIINDILDYSKIESGRMAFERVEFSLYKMARDAFALVAPSGAQKRLKLSLEFDPHLPTRVLGDPGRVRQALLNLLSNAVKFTEAGKVAAHVGVIAEDAGRNPCRVRFEVKDTGIGISAQTVARLFEPFTQADASTTRRFGGTGLGLAISKNLVEMMGGQIGCETEVGKGSTFWFVLPFATTAPAPSLIETNPAKLEAASATNGSGVRILVVEDNLVNQKVAFHVLRRLGHEVDVASTGREAIEAYRRHRYPVILMDAHMPDLDGYETTRLIREIEGSSRQTAIIALTANVMPGDRQRCLDAGMDDYIPKPIQPPLFGRVIGEWLRTMESLAG
jgi:PAS domain S-box-containing protein